MVIAVCIILQHLIQQAGVRELFRFPATCRLGNTACLGLGMACWRPRAKRTHSSPVGHSAVPPPATLPCAQATPVAARCCDALLAAAGPAAEARPDEFGGEEDEIKPLRLLALQVAAAKELIAQQQQLESSALRQKAVRRPARWRACCVGGTCCALAAIHRPDPPAAVLQQ